MPADLTAIRAIHARIPPPGNLPGGWMRAYQQDVGTLLARVDELEAEVAGLHVERAALTQPKEPR